MIGQCLSNKNENGTVSFSQKKIGTKQGLGPNAGFFFSHILYFLCNKFV